MIRILHCADIHLDSPFAADTPERAAHRRRALRGTFAAMIDFVRCSGVDLVLIAGDLFDREFVTRETVREVTDAFASVPDCLFAITPGNHDPFTPDSVYAQTVFPENVILFGEETLTRVPIDRLGVDLYGYAFRTPELTVNPFAGRQPVRSDRINLLCAHGSLNASGSTVCPISLSEIAGSGFDYYAFGHYHNSDGIHRLGTRCYAYSGCLEGRDFGETGQKGALLVEIEKENGVPRIEAHFEHFTARRYEILKCNLTGIADAAEGCRRIAAGLDALGCDAETALRVVAEGVIPPDIRLSAGQVRAMAEGRSALIEWEDHTLPLFDEEALKCDLTLRGAFYRALLPKLRSEDAAERERAALALRYGLTAMEGGDLDYD